MPRVHSQRRGRPRIAPRLLASCNALRTALGIAFLLAACSDRPTPVAPAFRGDSAIEAIVALKADRVTSVEVTPSSASIPVGDTTVLSATPRDARGNPVNGRVVTWSTSDTTIATVSPSGTVTARGVGSATIVAKSDGKSGSAALTVTAPTVPPPPAVTLPVVPGLVGFGTTTPAGRGGAVIRVTNLNDDGEGSLRAALTATGPRVVVFEISGTVTLSSKIAVTSPYVTVAGQTAPSPGITLKGAGISIRTNDVLIQHLRFRTGVTSAGNNDGLEVLGPSGYNVVADHISASWSGDENGSTWYGGAHDITFSNAIFSENVGSGAVLVGDGTKNLAIVNTLFAHNQDRNPYFKGGTTGVMANSVIYNWGGNQAFYTADPDGSGSTQLSVVGNVFIRGPSTPAAWPIQVYASSKPGTRLYVADNVDGRGMTPPADPWSLVRNDFGSSAVSTSPPVWPAGLTASSPSTAYSAVLSQAGAWPAARDAVDERVVGDVRDGTGQVATSAGPWPSLPVTRRALALPENPNGDDDGDGYTNLEEWMHAMARAAEGR